MIGERISTSNCNGEMFRLLICGGWLVCVLAGSAPWRCALGQESPPSAVGPLLGILQKGTLPPERIGNVAKIVSERGNEHDLAFLLSQAAKPEGWPVELRRDVLGWLNEAAATRKVQPAGDRSSLATLVASEKDAAVRRLAIELAGTLKVTEAVAALQQAAVDQKVPAALRDAAQKALISFGGDVAEQTIQQLLKPEQSAEVRMRGVAALAGIDLPRAATQAADVLQSGAATTDPAPLMDAFLNRKGGAEQLAQALEKTPPSADMALLALRHMYAVGRSDVALDKLLSRLAGINEQPPQLTEAEILQLAAAATREGDAARGEAVFRRADLACMRCHAVSKAGGQIGPDLSAVGVSSPVDYLVKSIYDPDAQKKEEFLTRILLTAEGQQITGIVTNRTEDKIELKTADGKQVTIATADLELEAEGRSLMPEGLVKFMTRQEVLDVVKFLSMLGKPNTDYAVRSTNRMQRWRRLVDPAPSLLESVPNEEFFEDLVLGAANWEPVYGRVNGELPLDEVVSRAKQSVVYVQGEVEVSAAGEVGLRLDSTDGVQVWIDDRSLPTDAALFPLDKGRHAVTLRIDTERRSSKTLKLELFRPMGSTAQFVVMDGA